ncbi:MAG: T9SS type A sorting domain-containing protein [bacterium]
MKRALIPIFLLFFCNLFAGIGVGYSAVGSLPVELTSFSAAVTNNSVLLNWTTATEINNSGFEIEKAIYNQDYSTASWIKIGFIKGEGTSTTAKSYSFNDTKPFNQKALYRLKQIDYNGTFSFSNIIEVSSVSLDKYYLNQNYPNPFNPSTTISYSIPSSSKVVVSIYDILGKLVTTLVDQNQEAGNYSINFSADNLSNGIYFYKIQAGSFNDVKKMMLIK